jgi:hypothetical protein
MEESGNSGPDSDRIGPEKVQGVNVQAELQREALEL